MSEHMHQQERRDQGRFRPEGLHCNLGQIVDLSMTGIRVLSRHEYHGEQTVVIRSRSAGEIRLKAKIAWRRQLSPSEHVFGMGFLDVSEAIGPRMQRLVTAVARGESQDSSGQVGGKRWFHFLGLALAGVAVAGLARALQEHAAWMPQYWPRGEDLVSGMPPSVWWVGYIVGSLIAMTGLSEMRRGRLVAESATLTVARPKQARDRATPHHAQHSYTDAPTMQAEIRRLRESQHLLNCILDSSLGGVCVLKAIRETDRTVLDFEIQLVNPAAEQMLGKHESIIVGKRLKQALPCLAKHSMLADMIAVANTALPLQKEYRLENGKWVQIAVVAIGDGLAVTFMDTTENHRAQDKLRHVAYHDELTGLPNRKLLMEHLERAFNRAKRFPNHQLAVLFLDFDRFKLVNDTLGHEVGDMLLNSISTRLRLNIRDVDTAAMAGQEQVPARLGGDEFVVMLDGVRDLEDATTVARRLLEAFSEPHQLGNHNVTSTASIGIAMSGPTYATVDELMRDADTAMYQAKNSGKARYVVFDQQMHESLVAQTKLESDLREATQNEDFTLVYEPIVDLVSGKVSGFEALIRWDHPERGNVPPDKFIPMAEELNLIVPIGEWAIKEAFKQLAAWKEIGAPDVFMNVNLSRAQLYDGDLCGLIESLLDAHQIEPSRLRLEITETMVMNDVALMAKALRELKSLGVMLALDDFGTGHSSLNVLQELPLDILKIDKTFIENAGEAVRRYGAIIATITELAQNLDMVVIAEGIERPEQVALLQGLNCDFAQGWMFSRAINAEAAVALLQDGHTFSHIAA